ncbi:mitochondrial mRNA pseudouridine synthase RPUSD3-like isoform X1 [Scyliorhinus canicula]|uniref:mitochondrial mRNA pseudouridine synthase RPUSD3-like isoform X1 n=2 Tax=Scyliorhinus canicula TaxID=7830 RepID=UPI0018F5B392|nr:mitochondrial mRNA pseudouridine synthase RPUSD3-like isoform X1 [Scyliorhinus canicula]
MNHIRKQIWTGNMTRTAVIHGHSCFSIRRLVTDSALHLSSPVSWYDIQLKEQIQKRGQHLKKDKAVNILQDPGIPVLQKLTRDNLLDMLATSVVYQENPLIGINKPPGLPITGEDNLCLTSLLPELQQRLNLSKELHIVKASNRDYSGLVLLSTCHQTTKYIEDAFIHARRKKEAIANYCTVIVGVPEPAEGEISVALKKQNIGEHNLVVPVFHPTPGNFQRKEVKKAVTRYKVLDNTESCALVQLQPLTSFESQLQVHLTVKLCAVLGDHVHSVRLGKVLGVPFCLPVESAIPQTQVLDESLLRKLHFDQKQMWKMPLHLHLHKLVIPPFERKKSATMITAAPPAYFLRTLELLGLTMNEFAEENMTKKKQGTVFSSSSSQYSGLEKDYFSVPFILQ